MAHLSPQTTVRLHPPLHSPILYVRSPLTALSSQPKPSPAQSCPWPMTIFDVGSGSHQEHRAAEGSQARKTPRRPATFSVTCSCGTGRKSNHGRQRPFARMTHEHCCTSCRFAAAASLRPAGSSLGPSMHYKRTPQVIRAPHAGLATRLSDCATNHHESCRLDHAH